MQEERGILQVGKALRLKLLTAVNRSLVFELGRAGRRRRKGLADNTVSSLISSPLAITTDRLITSADMGRYRHTAKSGTILGRLLLETRASLSCCGKSVIIKTHLQETYYRWVIISIILSVDSPPQYLFFLIIPIPTIIWSCNDNNNIANSANLLKKTRSFLLTCGHCSRTSKSTKKLPISSDSKSDNLPTKEVLVVSQYRSRDFPPSKRLLTTSIPSHPIPSTTTNPTMCNGEHGRISQGGTIAILKPVSPPPPPNTRPTTLPQRELSLRLAQDSGKTIATINGLDASDLQNSHFIIQSVISSERT